jgi:hypothetical protein
VCDRTEYDVFLYRRRFFLELLYGIRIFPKITTGIFWLTVKSLVYRKAGMPIGWAQFDPSCGQARDYAAEAGGSSGGVDQIFGSVFLDQIMRYNT